MLPIPLELIAERAALVYFVPLVDLCSSKRYRSVVKARRAYVVVSRVLLGASFPEIGRAIGTEQSTVFMAYRRAMQEWGRDPVFRDTVRIIGEQVAAQTDDPPGYAAWWAKWLSANQMEVAA